MSYEQDLERFEIEQDLRTKTREQLIQCCLDYLDIANTLTVQLDRMSKLLEPQ